MSVLQVSCSDRLAIVRLEDGEERKLLEESYASPAGIVERLLRVGGDLAYFSYLNGPKLFPIAFCGPRGAERARVLALRILETVDHPTTIVLAEAALALAERVRKGELRCAAIYVNCGQRAACLETARSGGGVERRCIELDVPAPGLDEEPEPIDLFAWECVEKSGRVALQVIDAIRRLAAASNASGRAPGEPAT